MRRKKRSQSRKMKSRPTTDELKDYLKDRIETYFHFKKETVEYAIKIGRLLLDIQRKEGKVKSHKIISEEFPELGKAERFTSLAKKVSLSTYPNLAYLSRPQLYELIERADGKSVGEYLQDNENEADLSFESDVFSLEEVGNFIDKIERFLKQKRMPDTKKGNNVGLETLQFIGRLVKFNNEKSSADKKTIKDLKKIKKTINDILDRQG